MEVTGKKLAISQGIARGLRNEITLGNLVSLSRPIIAYYALTTFIDEPVYLSLTLVLAFLTDALDGTLARRHRRKTPYDLQSRFGGYIDLAADRVLQLGTLWVYYIYNMVPFIIPFIFSLKDGIFDPTRVYMDLKKGTFTSTLAKYNRMHQKQTTVHGILEAIFICGVPIFEENVILILGIITAAFGTYRGIASILYSRKRDFNKSKN